MNWSFYQLVAISVTTLARGYIIYAKAWRCLAGVSWAANVIWTKAMARFAGALNFKSCREARTPVDEKRLSHTSGLCNVASFHFGLWCAAFVRRLSSAYCQYSQLVFVANCGLKWDRSVRVWAWERQKVDTEVAEQQCGNFVGTSRALGVCEILFRILLCRWN